MAVKDKDVEIEKKDVVAKPKRKKEKSYDFEFKFRKKETDDEVNYVAKGQFEKALADNGMIRKFNAVHKFVKAYDEALAEEIVALAEKTGKDTLKDKSMLVTNVDETRGSSHGVYIRWEKEDDTEAEVFTVEVTAKNDNPFNNGTADTVRDNITSNIIWKD